MCVILLPKTEQICMLGSLALGMYLYTLMPFCALQLISKTWRNLTKTYTNTYCIVGIQT